MPEAMSADLDPDLALVRKLHLELNGSGRRTRGPAPPPVKKVKRETSRHLDEALKESSSVSISGSGSGSGKALKREGTLKRLIKKQPNNSDSNQDTVAEDEEQNAEAASLAAVKESLEPQASTKAVEKRQKIAARGGDVGSTITPELGTETDFALNADAAANLARAAASREKHNASTRVKCFYMGYPYGLSFRAQAFESRNSLANALQAALSSEYSVCSSEEMEMFAYDKDGNQLICSPEDSLSHWDSAVKSAKRIYVSNSASA